MPALAPPAPDDPAQLGPFLLRGRWSSSEAGTAYQGLAPDGRAVTVVALGPGPSRDAAARDRFAAAVAGLARAGPGTLLTADPDGPWPWAALPAAPGQPADAGPVGHLLSAVTPAVAVGAVARGPAFAPHWTGERRLPPPPPPAPGPVTAAPARTDRRALVIVLAVLLALLLVLVLALVWQRTGDEPADPFATPAPGSTAPPTSGPPTSGPPTSGPPTSGQPTATPPTPAPPTAEPPTSPAPGSGPTGPLQPGPGVAGPSFGAQEQTREMRLEGLPFPFRTPATWGCQRSDVATPPAVRWVCLDDRWILEERPGSPPGGVIHVQPCPAPCGDDAWQSLRTEHAPDADWQVVDVATVVHEDTEPDTAGTYRIRMSHVFASSPGGPPDTHVYVRMTAPQGFEDDVRKVVNDIRANTP